MRERIEDIRAAGAELFIIGSGSSYFARVFREDMKLDCRVLVDPELDSFRAAGLRRGRIEILSPRVPLNAIRALMTGARQGAVQGDAWQLGGTFVIRPDNAVVFAHRSREAGDHPDVNDVIAAAGQSTPKQGTSEAGASCPLTSRALSFFVDPTIVLSFDRTGYKIHALGFDPADLDVDLDDRHCVITGGNSGLGFEAALALAERGARLTLICRDASRAQLAVAEIRTRTKNDRVTALIADMSDLGSVRAVAARLLTDVVDVLIHNAGLLPAERILSADGLELTYATHVIGPHVLTKSLLPALARAKGGRVIFVTSGGMYTRRLNLEDPNWEKRDYDGVLAYAETKRAQVVLSELWAERLEPSGIVVNAMHPGWADTPGVQSSLPTFRKWTQSILRTPAEGADTIVWLAASQKGGRYTGELVFDRRARRKHLLPLTRESQEDRAELWRRCEGLAAKSQHSSGSARGRAGAGSAV